MKLGVIGTGKIVQEFLPNLKNVSSLSINAMLSTPRSLENAKKLGEDNGIPFVTDQEEAFFSSDIDTVYVAVPNHLHFSYCEKALKRHLNVIVEKPITSTVLEAKRLKELAVQNDCYLFEAITTLYLSGYTKIKEWLPRIGTIKLAQSQYSQYSSRYDAFLKGEILPAFDPKKAGGALMDLNLYNIFYITGLFGKPLSQKYYPNMDRGIDTSGVLIMQYDGFQALCAAAKDSKGLRQGIIQGTKGVITSLGSANVGGKIILELNDGTREEYDSPNIHRAIVEFEQFIQMIETNDTERCHALLDTSITVSEIINEARRDAGIVFADD